MYKMKHTLSPSYYLLPLFILLIPTSTTQAQEALRRQEFRIGVGLGKILILRMFTTPIRTIISSIPMVTPIRGIQSCLSLPNTFTISTSIFPWDSRRAMHVLENRSCGIPRGIWIPIIPQIRILLTSTLTWRPVRYLLCRRWSSLGITIITLLSIREAALVVSTIS